MKLLIFKFRYVLVVLAAGLLFAAVFNLTRNQAPETPAPREELNLSQEDRDWIQSNPVITVGVDLDFAPIENMGPDNQYIGVTADFLSLISRKTGLTFKIDHQHSWEESLERIKAGKIHMLGAAVPSEQRKEFMDFSQPYAWLSGVIIVRKAVTEPMSLEKLKGMEVTVVHNYIWKDILEKSYPDLDLNPAQDIGAALNKVSFGMADAMVGYMATASHHIERLGISNLKISGETISVLDISFAVSKTSPRLKQILNKVLDQTTENQKKAILRKWISLEFSKDNNIKRLTRILFPGVALVLLGLIAIIIWNRALQRQVTQRTETLNRELIQRTHMEKALRESEEKYRSIFGNIQDVYYEILPKGRVIEISPSIEKVFGYNRASMLDQSMSRMFVDPREFRDMLGKATFEERLDDHETLLVRPDGKQLNCSMNAVLIRDSQGAPLKIIGSIHNITERVKAQKALRMAYNELEKRVRERTAELRNTNRELNKAKETADAATRAKSNFLANMSHEIRTPLSGVISASELVMHEALPKKVARYINIIRTSGHALLGVIDDILDFSKIEAGKLDIEVHPFYLEQLITRTTNLFKQKIAEKEISFEVEIALSTPAHLKGDSFRLQQILTNLLSNALKFTDRGGRITLGVSGSHCTHKADRVFMEFMVADSGIGISPEHQDLLFTPFSQIDASTTRKYGGSGLGLSICGQLVEMMEGTITVESRPAHGSSFLFTIPLELWENPDLEQAAPVPDRFASLATYRSLLRGKRILVAEDTPTNQEIILAVLALAGIETSLVDTGDKAVKAVRDKDFHAVLMDLQMPEMDGFEATRTIRRQKDKTHLPIIAMTAHTMKEDEGKCMAAGMNGYISKPINQDKLFKTLIDLIHDRKTDGEIPGPPLPAPSPTPQPDPGEMLSILPKQVPGLELQTAVNNLGVGEEVFLHILDTFFKNHESIITRIETAWAGGDKEAVTTMIHSLKGSASGIGATEVSNLARDMESLCKKSAVLPAMDKAGLAVLENALTIVLASIKALPSGAGGPETPADKQKPAQLDHDQACTALRTLEKALDFPELGELEQLMTELTSTCDHPLVEQIKNHIDSHDHDLAKQDVVTLHSQLKGPAQ
ncbi:MAG: transporter substrate-binding domain-containing protein [Desulfobacterales bacterium]|nr:transporter substrate-binding domain-containing protein [Desulfobacterales bacterium]